VVDMPCGYTPRAIAFAKKGLPYYGLDLPVVIREASAQIPALISPEQRGLVHYCEVDATNYASLEKALEDIEGGVCITTEGLLMYFTDSEAGALCDNIRRILEKKGGCWYTADAEASLQYVVTMRALVGDRFMEIMKNATRQTSDKSDVQIGKNALITKPADMPGSIQNAMAFLAKHGLKAERVTVAEHMPELTSLLRVSPQQATAVREGMKRCAFWKITLSAAAPAMELPSSETEGFGIHASMNGIRGPGMHPLCLQTRALCPRFKPAAAKSNGLWRKRWLVMNQEFGDNALIFIYSIGGLHNVSLQKCLNAPDAPKRGQNAP